MGAATNNRGPRYSFFIEWRASHIQDPVSRLRYLQRVTRLKRLQHAAEWFPHASRWRLVSAILWASFLIPVYTPSRPRITVERPVKLAASSKIVVWPVERTAAFDLYSNGLRIENEFAVPGEPRKPYPVVRTKPKDLESGDAESVEWRTGPVGIVFHSTESHLAPFDASEAKMLQRLGRNLLDYVRSQQSYHFVIDRFGRVFRVVSEAGIANHSGKSVWSDSRGIYVGLNASFLSVAFEAQTDTSMPLSAAQIHSARILTDMLRAKFGIPESNCVTHAQVSVNSTNWRIGYHTDWAAGFPFSVLGLPDNYAQPVPSMTLFGFEFDDAFLSVAGRPWAGLLMARELVEEQARANGMSTAAYRKQLRERYRRLMSGAQLRPNQESKDENQQD